MDLGAPEIIIIALVVLLLFGANRLPDFARGTGRALRIFKAETKGLTGQDEPPSDVAGEPADQVKPVDQAKPVD